METKNRQSGSPVSVTILLPAYNEEQAVAKTVKRIKDIYPDFEVLVIDDGSTDNTMQAAMDAGAGTAMSPVSRSTNVSVPFFGLTR